MNIDFFMKKALDQAKKALLMNEVPVGAVLVDNKTHRIINSAHNLIEFTKNSTAHAEMILINNSIDKYKDKFLKETSMFITLEPCAMCAAAISEAKINKVYFGAYDEGKGEIENNFRLFNKKKYFKPEIYGGIKEKECSTIIKNFFIKKRKFHEY